MRRFTMSTVAALAVTTLLTSSAMGQEEEAGLCRLIEFDQLNSLSDVRYDETPFWDLADNCKYLATSDPNGSHYARLHLDGMVPFESLRDGALNPVDIEVGGFPAFSASDLDPRGWLNTQVLVDLGDPSFRVTLIADEGTDPDQMASTIRLAEIAVANLDPVESEAIASPTQTDSGITAIVLPEVEGIDWQGPIEGYGSQITELAEAGMNLPFEVLLDELGADLSQLGFHVANAVDASTGEQIGNYLAVRVEGVDASRLQPAAVAWLSDLVSGQEVSMQPAQLAGRDVVVIDVDPETDRALYVGEDTVHLITLPEPMIVALLETLP